MRLGSVVVAVVLGWPAAGFCQNPTLDLLASVHDGESLVAATRRYDDLPRPVDVASLRTALNGGNQLHAGWFAAMMLVGNGRAPIAPELLVLRLVEAIHHGEPAVRKLAFAKLNDLSLGYTGFDEICASVNDRDIIAAMRDSDADISLNAIRVLSDCPRFPVLAAAREIAQGGFRDSRGRYLLITALAERGPEARLAADALITALDDDAPDVRDAAARALRSAAVDPELYVPAILEDVRNGATGYPGAHPLLKLEAVAPAAARWAPDIAEMLRNERSPQVREPLQRALNKTGVQVPEPIAAPEAERVVARKERRLEGRTPWIAFFVAAIVVSVVLATRGWGVLLAFLFPSLPLIAGIVLADDAWEWLPVLMIAPVCGLVGAGVGFLLASGESGVKRSVGLAGGGVSAVAMLIYGVILVGLYYGLAPFGAG